MVSIMPGIEKTAPDRTDTSSGFAGSPRRFPVRSSRRPSAASTWSRSPSGQSPLLLVVATQACVVTVKASGTGTPILFISARLAPLPPSNIFNDASPSCRS